MNEALCILSAGRGTRLGEYTTSTNKALLPICGKAAISHIIEKTTGDVVVAIGYEGDKVVEHCRNTHPDRNITFVSVDNFDGPGSGPGYSLRQCREHLQRPFVLCFVDCLVLEDYPPLDEDWIALAPTTKPEIYWTFNVVNGSFGLYAGEVRNKRVDGFPTAFVGLCGIRSYSLFWRELDKHDLVDVLPKLKLGVREVTWFDVGNVDAYMATKKVLESSEQTPVPQSQT